MFNPHVADGINYTADTTKSGGGFDPATGVTTFVGSVVNAWVRNAATQVSTQATSCTVASATQVQAIFAPGLLPAGLYNLQIQATPPGKPLQVISDTDWLIKANAGP